jgi:hypothetical protein
MGVLQVPLASPPKLEGHTNHAQVAGSAFAGLQNGQWWWIDSNHEATLPFPKVLSGSSDLSMGNRRIAAGVLIKG